MICVPQPEVFCGAEEEVKEVVKLYVKPQQVYIFLFLLKISDKNINYSKTHTSKVKDTV